MLVIDGPPEMGRQVSEQAEGNGGKVDENVVCALGRKHIQQLLSGIIAMVGTGSFEQLHLPRGEAHVIVRVPRPPITQRRLTVKEA